MNWQDIFNVQTGVTSSLTGALGISIGIIIAVIFIWSLVWKGLALWKSARKKHLIWFVVLLIVNTVGILEILYIFIFSKMSLGKAEKTKKKK